MADTRNRIPSLELPAKGYKLLKEYAKEHDLSMSRAVRKLLAESPELIAFARQRGEEMDFSVGDWGGYRERKDE